MMEQLLAAMILTAVVIASLGIVISISGPLVEASRDTVVLRDAEALMNSIDNSIREIVKEGQNSKRVLSMQLQGGLETLPEEDAVQLSFHTKAALADYLSRSADGSLVILAGNDVNCRNQTNLTMENTFLNVTFRKTERRSPLLPLNMTESIISITEKESSTQVRPSNSTIIINDNQSSSRGTGYSELLRAGTSLPSCMVHFYLNNTAIEYDAYYTLYAGADFLVVDVTGIREK